MIQTPWRRLAVAFSLSFASYFFPHAALAAAKPSQAAEGSATQASSAPAHDHTQWRKLHRKMSKDEVKNLLGDPETVSVSRFAEVWYYLRGSVTFNGKGHLDMWTEY